MLTLKDQNILYFTRSMGLGGVENVILQLCEVFAPLVNKIVVCSCGGLNVEKLKAMGIKHYEIPDMEQKSPGVLLKIARSVTDIVKRENISLIHTHHRMAAFYVEILRLYKKCLFFETAHNVYQDKIKLVEFTYRHANVIACGEMVKKNLTDVYHIPAERIDVVHNAVKPFEADISDDFLIKSLKEQGKFVIGNVGRLSEQKGMEYYIKAVPMVVDKHPEARFLIIGEGPDEHKLKKLAESLGVDKYVYFTGYRSDVQNLMSQLDLVVLSSLWEGLPLTAIEAISVGKAMVATAVGGTVEVIQDGVTGRLVEPKNPSQLAEKILWMIEHPELVRQMHQNAKQRFLTDFSFSALAQGYIDCYQMAEAR